MNLVEIKHTIKDLDEEEEDISILKAIYSIVPPISNQEFKNKTVY